MFDHRCGFRSCSTPCIKAEGSVEAHTTCRVGVHAFWCLTWVALVVIVGCGWYSTFVDKSHQNSTPEEQFPRGIDLYYGIAWWSKGNVLHPVVNATTGLGQGPSPHFDPRKPTVIYSHGWQNGGVTGGGLERLTSHTGIHMADLWIDQGWNVGSFYWSQFADDTLEQAETKIWEDCLSDGPCYPSGPMTWKDKDGHPQPWKSSLGKPKSVGELFYDSVVACLASADSSSSSKFQLRLVGHSLGGGNVMAAGYKLAADADRGVIPKFMKPDRIAMLDPFWSVSREGQVLGRMYELSQTHGVTIELSRASDFSVTTRYGNQLKNMDIDKGVAAFSMVYPEYVDPLLNDVFSGPAEALRHMSAKTYYFLSIDPLNPNADLGPSARTTNAVLQNFAKSNKFWRQTEGLSTETILDDKYEVHSWSGSPPITGGTPESWILFFYSLSFIFLLLTSCVLCCCGCYVRLFVKAQSRSRVVSDSLETAMASQ